jgi:hypothetical protein
MLNIKPQNVIEINKAPTFLVGLLNGMASHFDAFLAWLPELFITLNLTKEPANKSSL